MKYLERLNQTAESTAATQNEMIAEEATLNLQQEMFKVKKEVVSKTNYIETLKNQKSLNFDAIVCALNELQLLERKAKQLNELKKELF
jgi:hypothetical protein